MVRPQPTASQQTGADAGEAVVIEQPRRLLLEVLRTNTAPRWCYRLHQLGAGGGGGNCFCWRWNAFFIVSQ